jgi:AAA15 family ATPase/GTPase
MLRSLHIKNFRLFRDLKIEHLSRVNLIAGKNNTGKTALLEALYLLFADTNSAFYFPTALRNSGKNLNFFLSFWSWLPYQKEILAKNEIRVLDETGQNYSVQWQPVTTDDPTSGIVFSYYFNDDMDGMKFSVVSNGGGSSSPSSSAKRPKVSIFSTNPSSPTEDADIFNQLVVKKRKKKLIEMLSVFEPELSDLQYLKVGNEPLVYAELPLPELIPITQLGQGFTRLFRFFARCFWQKLTSF